MRITGHGGTLRVGYQVAAALGDWTLEPAGPSRFQFHASILRHDDFWITRRPIDVSVPLGKAEWIWRDVHPQPSNEGIVIELTERPIVEDRRI